MRCTGWACKGLVVCMFGELGIVAGCKGFGVGYMENVMMCLGVAIVFVVYGFEVDWERTCLLFVW
jgi:hypothetical protein